MKQIANLYLAELQPSRQRLTLRLLLGINLAVLIFFGVLWGAGSILLNQQNAQHEHVRQQIVIVEGELQKQQKTLDQALNDPALNKALEEAQETFTQRNKLMTQMQSYTQQNQQSYSQLLFDLSAADQESIWLQRILVFDNALTIEGYTMKPQQLPIWLSSFSRYQTLQGRPFGVFELSDDTEQGLRFIIGHLKNSEVSTGNFKGTQK